MKKFNVSLIAFLILINIKSKSQTTIAFSYDAAGNMIQRQVQVIPPIPPGARFAYNEKDSANIDPNVNFKIYPNPAQTFVNIEGDLPEDTKEAKWQLLNNTGQVLKTGVYDGTTQNVSVQDLIAGIYLLEIRYNKKQNSTYKIIITN